MITNEQKKLLLHVIKQGKFSCDSGYSNTECEEKCLVFDVCQIDSKNRMARVAKAERLLHINTSILAIEGSY